MPQGETKTGSRAWFKRHWRKVTAVAVALSAFLGWYDTVRNNGRLFVCDLTALVGQSDAVSMCRAGEDPLDTGDQLALLEYLKSREGRLTPEKREHLRRLEAHLEERAFAELTKAAGLEDTPVDVQAKADTREAVRATVEEGDAEERRALDMIADGDVDGGLDLLSKLASAPAKKNAAQWRRIGRLAYAVDTTRALDAYERVVALDPSDPWDFIYLGRLYERAGDLDAASRAYMDALDHLPESKEWDKAAILDGIGDVVVGQGNLAQALAAYRASLKIMEVLAAADPSNAGWQRDLSVSQEKIGDVLVAQGKGDEALAAYRASLDISERLAAADPSNAGWQRDLSVSHNFVGNILLRQGDLAGALKEYIAYRDIIAHLAAADPSNAGWQRDLSVSHNKVGDVLVAQGKGDEALAAYRASQDIFERLAAADPSNAGWQRDLSVSHERTGDVLVAQGKGDEALAAYRASLDIRERLAAADPSNAGWQRDLSVSHNKIGDVLVAQGKGDEALAAYRASQDIFDRLAAADPSNAGWQRDLSVSHNKIGDVLVAQGKGDEALAAYRASQDIFERLAAADPSNAGWQRDLAWSHWRLAGHDTKPRVHWEAVVRILKELDADGRLAPVDRKWLPIAEQNLAASQ